MSLYTDMQSVSPPPSNYVEIIRCATVYDDEEGIVANCPSKSEYDRLMVRCINYFKNVKHFERQYKQFVHNDVYYNIVKATGEVSVYSLHPVCRFGGEIFNTSNLLTMSYEKKKLSILNFTSSMSYDNIVDVSKTTFRITNRIYINFEEHTYPDTQEVTYHAYINYNHDKNVDWDTIKLDLQRVIKIFVSS